MIVRRFFIAFGLTAFLVYCWASVAYQNKVSIPDYRLVDVDLLGGVDRAAWEANAQGRFQRLAQLEDKGYLLPVGTLGSIPPAHPLTAGDFEKLVAAAPANERPVVRLRDPSDINRLLGRHYRLRDDIPYPGNPSGPPLYQSGQPLNMTMLDRLRRLGWESITVVGLADPVGVRLGTGLMVAIIFLTLVAALKPFLWDPFMALLEKRRLELEMGEEAARQNQLEAIRYEEESRRRVADVRQEAREMRLKGGRDVAAEASEILREARTREKAAKLEGLRHLSDSARAAEEELGGGAADLAEAIVRALTPARPTASSAAKRTGD